MLDVAVQPRSILVVLVASLDDGLLFQQLGIDLDMNAVRKVSKAAAAPQSIDYIRPSSLRHSRQLVVSHARKPLGTRVRLDHMINT